MRPPNRQSGNVGFCPSSVACSSLMSAGHQQEDTWAQAVASALTPWFKANARSLTWRGTRDPYAIWVSEIMLQQTRVETVERYYARFLARFPTVDALAAADEDTVLEAWSGLGYYRRARLLHRGAQYVDRELGGALPGTAADLRRIPGVGAYTAGAIASIAFDQPEPLVDGNVARVFSRLRAVDDPAQQGAQAAEHWSRARAVLQHGEPRVLAQGLMELGATICTPKQPRCDACPTAHLCEAYRQGKQAKIPAPRKKEAPKRETWAALGVMSRRRLLLIKRPSSGLLAGMWCLPLVATSGNAGELDASAVLVDVDGASFEPRSGTVKHVFTHRVWELQLFVARLARRPECRQEHQWIAPGERPEGGVPSVTEKLCSALAF